MIDLSPYSLEYVFISDFDGPDDPSALTHELAVVETEADVTADDWIEATWDATASAPRILVRASDQAPAGGDITLERGTTYSFWWRAQSNPEYPARHSGYVRVR